MPETIYEQPSGLQTPFHEAAAAAVRKAFDEIRKNWDGSLGGADIEAIHDLRVGTRRLRAALSVYEAAFPLREFKRVERTMSRLTDALGPARDTDVLIEHVEKVIDSNSAFDDAERHGLRFYVHHLRDEREERQEALVHAMQRTDLEGLAADLESVVAGRAD